VMTLKNSALMIDIAPVSKPHLLLVSETGKGMIIETKQVPQLSGQGMGVKLIKLAEGKLAGFKFVSLKDKVILGLSGGKTREIPMRNVPVYKRGSQGVFISKRNKIIKIL